MKIYNTLSRKKEDFVPIEDGNVSMYVCGPTVYNFIHIGNARPFVTFDTVRRYFEYKDYDVTYVQNFTDIDDKIIKKANEEHTTSAEIAERYIKEVQIDSAGLNVKPPTVAPRVTEEMPEIIKMIEELVQKGFAYEKNGSVYFDTSAFDGYGKLSHKNIEDLEAGARVEVDEDKKSPMDFILWKPKKVGEPSWPSPWSDGRPGWHIECSVMARKYLGATIDIHAGGEDLVFPHHENEIAQSEAANGQPFAHYFMHNGFINVDNQKMSKSKGNFFTLREISAEFPYAAIRFFLLSVHYRSPINFSRETLQSAQNGLERIKKCVFNLKYLLAQMPDDGSPKDLPEEISSYIDAFEKKMDDDFNTADAISIIFELVTFANKTVAEDPASPLIQSMLSTILMLADILGLHEALLEHPVNTISVEKIEELIEERQQAKKAKNYALADGIRTKLSDMGVLLEDTRSGVRYSFKESGE